MEVPFQGVNMTTAKKAIRNVKYGVRVTVEWDFKGIMIYWTTVEYKQKTDIVQSPVGALYLANIL